MTRNAFRTLVIAAAFSALPAFSASATIGVASAVSTFSLNDATVSGHVDVADGAQLRTTIAPSDVRLGNGVEVMVATRSQGTVYNDHVVLWDGAVRVSHFNSYPIQASDLQIQADNPGTQAMVRISGKTIEVASIGGTVKVTDGGAMLTRVAAGTKMSFQNNGSTSGQTGAAPAQTGAAPAPVEKGPISDHKAILWGAGVCAGGAIAVGAIAAAQGKSPF